jgi:hypothetical protein
MQEQFSAMAMDGRQRLVPLEVLDFTFVPFSRLARDKRAEIAPHHSSQNVHAAMAKHQSA